MAGDESFGASLLSTTTEPVLPDARFTFVVGKGGVGKTTTAAALACELAQSGRRTHLISIDPAHSLADYFAQPLDACAVSAYADNPRLLLEEFPAESYGKTWLDEARPAIAELIERGTYLEAADAFAFFDRAIPGVDEVMAAFRIAELEASDAQHIVIDTAPTGHLLRLLDAPQVVATWIDTLEAMNAKAQTVASALLGNVVRLRAAETIELWRRQMAVFQSVLQRAEFIVVTRPDAVVHAETRRLLGELERRDLRAAQLVEVRDDDRVATAEAADSMTTSPVNSSRGNAAEWLLSLRQRILFFAGKGGVGKSTCAAAAAELIGARRKTLLFSTDPAGSLSDVFGVEVGNEPVQLGPQLYARQLDAPTVLHQWRESNRIRIEEVLATLGIAGSARLDHNVIARIWQLAPPGLDELIAFAEMLDAIDDDQTVIVDSAPTGHFLRLLAMPEAAIDWAHAVMRLILKYGAVGTLEDVARDLLEFAKQAKRLRHLLSDTDQTGVVIVTLPEPLVLAETERLHVALENATIPTSATLFNRTEAGPEDPRSKSIAGRSVRAPVIQGGIIGRAGLLQFVNSWELLD